MCDILEQRQHTKHRALHKSQSTALGVWSPLPDAEEKAVAAESLDSPSTELVYALGCKYGKRLR